MELNVGETKHISYGRIKIFQALAMPIFSETLAA
jgi:hypothetical protein